MPNNTYCHKYCQDSMPLHPSVLFVLVHGKKKIKTIIKTTATTPDTFTNILRFLNTGIQKLICNIQKTINNRLTGL